MIAPERRHAHFGVNTPPAKFGFDRYGEAVDWDRWSMWRG
jgi:hypothetical protein